MTSRTENARKRKETVEQPEVVVSSGSDDDQSQRKARRVSTNAEVSNATSLQVDTPVVTEKAATANTASAAIQEVDTPVATKKAITANTASAATEYEESIQCIGNLIQDLFHSESARVNAAIDALYLNLGKNQKKSDKIQAVGGCFALVQLLKNYLDKAIDGIPACDQVTELNGLPGLTTLRKTLNVITNLIFQHDESKIGVAAIGGVGALAKIMKTFPKCRALQLAACGTLRNLAFFSIGKAKAIESNGIEVVLAAIKNHLGSALVCLNACRALFNIVAGSKENTKLLISLGGGAAVAKVSTNWPDNNDVQTWMRKVANLIGAEMTAW